MGKSQIYCICAGETGPFKIGRTTKLKTRLSELQTGSPVKLTLMAFSEGDNKTEKIIHGLLADFRMHGEWFTMCSESVAIVEGFMGAELRPTSHIPGMEGKKYTIEIDIDLMESVDQRAREEAAKESKKFTRTDLLDRALRRELEWDLESV